MEANNATKNKHLPYFDVAKGILIICVAFSHICWATSTVGGLAVGDSWTTLNRIGAYLWVPFYMPAFFIITGFCSSFNKDFKTFLQSNVMTLLWPMLVITFQNHWFVYALFISKLLYYWINKSVKKHSMLWLVYVIITIVACLCQNVPVTENFSRWYLYHGMALAIYIPIGQELRNHIDRKWIFSISAIVYLTVVVYAYMVNWNLPSIFSNYNVSLMMLPLHLLLSVTGSIMLIGLSKLIKKNRILEYLGKKSLVIFFVHVIFISTIVTYLPVNTSNALHFFGVLIGSLTLSCIVAVVFNNNYLKWCLGKF